MEIWHGIDAFTPPPGGITLAIGNFDGVHRGHQRIISTARETAARLGTPVVVMTFEPHPVSILAPQRAPARLVTAEERRHLLERYGADACIVLRSESALLEQSAETFLEMVRRRCRPRALVEGEDFNFGRGRAGSVQTLRQFAQRLDYAVYVVETEYCDGCPGAPAIRSSAIRAALREGNVEIARAMLGRPYRVSGTVGVGAARGARLGFPTANVQDIPHLLPREVVYAAVAQLADGTLRLAAVNVGQQPTFGDSTPRVEAHLLDWSAPLHGQRLGLHFLQRLRAQQRFAGRAELIEQIGRDVAATRAQADALQELHRHPPIPI